MIKALLLSAGYGTRLKPYTDRTPKPLIKIFDQPLIEQWIRKLNAVGIKDILINTHYKHKKIEDFINQKNFKNITLTYEKKLLGTGGTLIKNINYFEKSDCILIHTDNYCEEDLNLFISTHTKRPEQCLMTMMAFKTKKPEESGIIKKNKDNILTNFYEKNKNYNGNLANGAVYLLSKDMLSKLKKIDQKLHDFSNDIIYRHLNQIYIYQVKKNFIDIGDKDSMYQAIKMRKNFLKKFKL